MKLTYLAPEIPSVSATFVYQELLAHETAGHRVQAVALRDPSPAPLDSIAGALKARTHTLYSRPVRMTLHALGFAVRHPLKAAWSATVAVRDMACGQFAKDGQRWKIPVQLIAGLAVARQMTAFGSEHLHVHFAHSPANVGMYASLASGVPFSVTAHANDVFVEASLMPEKLRRARPFVTVTRSNKKALLSTLGKAASTVRVQHCGVDTARFSMRSETQVRDLYLLAVGRLVQKKGFADLLHAFAIVSRRHPDLRLIIAGDGPERANLTELATTLGVQNRVSFSSSVTHAMVRTLLRGAIAFCLPCCRAEDGDRDGLPVALMEAMATGVPVVTTTLGGIPELVENRVNGFTVEPGDRVALGGALLTVVEQPRRAAGLANAGRRAIEQRFDLHTNARRLAGWFHPRRGLAHGPSLLPMTAGMTQ